MEEIRGEYFRIAGDPDYGKLSKKDFTAINDGARVDLDEYRQGFGAGLRHVEGSQAG